MLFVYYHKRIYEFRIDNLNGWYSNHRGRILYFEMFILEVHKGPMDYLSDMCQVVRFPYQFSKKSIIN